MKVAFLVNDVETEDPRYATTRLAMAALRRGHEVWYLGAGDFQYGADEIVRARARPAPSKRKPEAFVDALLSEQAQSLDVDDLDVLFMRNDPSVDAIDRPWAFSACLTFGQLVAERGPLVVNDPVGLGKAIDKLYLQQFPRTVRPATLITRDPEAVREFVDTCPGPVVLKPLQGSGGQSVFLVGPDDGPNLSQMIETVERDGYIVAQEYLPAGSDGDVRLFLLEGQPLCVDGVYAAFRRVPQGDELRSNMHAGGTAEPVELDERMFAVAEACRPRLAADGMFFVGLDLIGDQIIELNVGSPGGLNALHELTGLDFATPIIEAMERRRGE